MKEKTSEKNVSRETLTRNIIELTIDLW